ncbi:MAG: YebC/PmpR family DNA-binding transcriptional regulator [Bacteroidetes bacterium]|nr:MAG: YebC/PmpR family DNA-binding transcriptional regulator [Bacteroidota bacterium]PTM13607.1 MAG: YebC/PmpR family DNA-binding transcriptional regulator [Bacteroidota bacterium]
MGRAFEFRKERKMKRWASMAKTFTKIGREIAIAVKEGGGAPEYNPRLRMAIQNAKSANMPKTNVDSAIKRALAKDSANYDEITYEGYGPAGIAVVVETATDNTNRTVANLRLIFSKGGGNLGNSGEVDYMFSRKGQFKLKAEGLDQEELELELIDHGLEDLKHEDEFFVLLCAFEDFGKLQKALEERNIELDNAELIRIPSHTKELTDEQAEAMIKLLDKLEEDEDVINVFHNMDMSE